MGGGHWTPLGLLGGTTQNRWGMGDGDTFGVDGGEMGSRSMATWGMGGGTFGPFRVGG